MPRAKKTDMFYIIKAPTDYRRVGKQQMLGVNVFRKGHENMTLNDLLKFLKEHEVGPEKVLLNSSFTGFIIV